MLVRKPKGWSYVGFPVSLTWSSPRKTRESFGPKLAPAERINGSLLETYGIVVASFQVLDILGRARFLPENVLLADASMGVVFKMPFRTLSNADVH